MIRFSEAEGHSIVYSFKHTLISSSNKQADGFADQLFFATCTRLAGAELSNFEVPLYEHFLVGESQRLIHRVTPL